MGLSADETMDLRDPGAWRLSQQLGNPASLLSNEMRALFDVAFRGDYAVRKSILEFDNDYIKTEELSWEAGFGSVYWMEGVVVRLQVGLSQCVGLVLILACDDQFSHLPL